MSPQQRCTGDHQPGVARTCPLPDGAAAGLWGRGLSQQGTNHGEPPGKSPLSHRVAKWQLEGNKKIVVLLI